MKTTKIIKIITAIALTATGFTACKKNSDGGKATIAALPAHHGKEIFGATAYVKFGATELPSDPTTNYDLKIVGEAKENHVHIEDLRYGKYYVYMVGYDSTIKQVVKGGVPAHIKYSQRAKEIDLNVPVTE